jgi:hypothetical protein
MKKEAIIILRLTQPSMHSFMFPGDVQAMVVGNFGGM